MLLRTKVKVDILASQSHFSCKHNHDILVFLRVLRGFVVHELFRLDKLQIKRPGSNNARPGLSTREEEVLSNKRHSFDSSFQGDINQQVSSQYISSHLEAVNVDTGWHLIALVVGTIPNDSMETGRHRVFYKGLDHLA